MADKIKATGNKIIANGNDGISCGNTSSGCHEGMGGAGGGGAVLIKTNTFIGNTIVEAIGGKGANMTASGFLKVGPGGGGGSGVLYLSNPSLSANISVTNNGGTNGVCTAYSNNPFGATPGQNGTTLFNLVVPIDNILFKPNIDSVRINKRLVTCDSFNFNGLGYTNTNPVASWQWYFGDGGTATTQNAGHTYTPGPYTVKLIVTDINGCKDSITTNIIASTLGVDAGPDDIICSPNSTDLQGTTNGATQFAWTPANYLNNPGILNPTATPPVTTWFYLTATNANGCSRKDSVLVSVRSATGFAINPPADICPKKPIQLSASGGDIFVWQPAGTLDNPVIFNPTATPSVTTIYSVFITDTVCNNTTTLFTTITVLPLPLIRASKRNDIDCSTPQSQLSASGGIQYSWTPAGSLNNANSGSPVATPTLTTQYIVTGTNLAGCSNLDSVIVKVSPNNKGGYFMPTGFTPNNDGLNDCFGVKLWGTITEIDFSIFNRWGEKIFHTTKIGDCWNGLYKGVLQDSDVYVFMIKAKTTCEPVVFRKGTFVLIR
jgi:gliding motility-associated-like protein